MGIDPLTPSEFIERHEQRLREQLNEGCRLARELDERVRSIPSGRLSGGSDQSDAASSSTAAATQLRCSIAIATADIVAAFNKSIKLLLQSPDCSWDSPSALSAAGSPLQTAHHASPQKATCKPACGKLSVETTSIKGAEQTKSPQHSTGGWLVKTPAAADQSKRLFNRACASETPSPPRMNHSPSLLSGNSDMSDGSPKPNQPDLPADEATTANPCMRALVCRKRKLQPKVSLKMPACSAETAENNTPPDDGHTWRKYGQKNILGAQYPRSYYRCTHKTDTGCPAIKQVQRCDEDDAFFDVVYKGYHTCRSAELDKECWPLAFPQGLSSMLRFPNNSATLIPPAAAAASLMLANINAANQSNSNASLDHFLCNVGPVASSDALPLVHNSELSVTQAHTPTSAPGSFLVSNSALQPYQFNSGSSLLPIINDSSGLRRGSVDHLHPLILSNSSATAIQDESAIKNELRRATGIGGDAQEELHGNSPYAQIAERAGRAVHNDVVEEWAGFENASGEIYKRLACTSGSYGGAAPHQHAAPTTLHEIRQRPRPLLQQPTTLNIPKHDDAPLAFDGMDNDDDLLWAT